MRLPLLCVSILVAATVLASCGEKPAASPMPVAQEGAVAAKGQQLKLTYFTMPR